MNSVGETWRPWKGRSALTPSCQQNRSAAFDRLSLAFTLLELLVVVGITGLLAALLVPALQKARNSAYRTQCVSNLRQLALAAQMYWDDHGGVTFRYRGAATNGGDIYWFGWLERGVEGTRRFDAAQSALFPYLAGRGVQICPSLDYRMRQFKRKATGAAFGYGYNLGLSATASEPAVNTTQMSRPAETALFADAAQVNTFQPPASPDNPMLEEFYYLSTNEPTVHFRHEGVANAAFCDGHIAGEKPEPGSLDPRMPHQRVGRLRSEKLLAR